jgi:hypothetical protein
MLIEIAKKGRNLRVEVGYLILQAEEGPPYWLQGERLNNRPFLNRLRFCLTLQEKPDFL